jgi:hypothetical protein
MDAVNEISALGRLPIFMISRPVQAQFVDGRSLSTSLSTDDIF